MKADDLNKYFESVKPSAGSKEKMLYAILSCENSSSRRSSVFKYVCTAAVLLVFACGIAISSVKLNTVDKIAQKTINTDKYEVQTSGQKTGEDKTGSDNDFAVSENVGDTVKSDKGVLSEKRLNDTSDKNENRTVKQRRKNVEGKAAASEKKSEEILDEKVTVAQATSETEQNAFSGGGARRSAKSSVADMSDEKSSIDEETVDSSGTAMLSCEPVVASAIENAEATENTSEQNDDDEEKDADKNENDTESKEEEGEEKDSETEK